MKLGKGKLHKPNDDYDPAVRDARFRYFKVYVGQHPEVTETLTPLHELWSKATRGGVGYSYQLLTEIVEDDQNLEFTARAEDIAQFLQALDEWYQDHNLERLGAWVKDIGISFFDDLHTVGSSQREGYTYRDYILSPADQRLEVKSFITYLLEKETLQDDVFGVRYSTVWRYNVDFNTPKRFREEALQRLKIRLNNYIKEVEGSAKKQEYASEGTEKRETNHPLEDHFYWLYLRHIEGCTIKKVEDRLYQPGIEVEGASISDATNSLSSLIGIRLT